MNRPYLELTHTSPECKAVEPNAYRCSFLVLPIHNARLLTTEALIAANTLSVAEAMQIYGTWLKDPRVSLQQEPRGLDRSLQAALWKVGPHRAPKAVADCYLAAFAKSSGAHLVTFDKALAKFCKDFDLQVELLKP